MLMEMEKIITTKPLNQNKMKQTAVDWLIKQLTPSISLQQKHIDELKEKAKEMEKEQIVDAWDNGWHEHMNPPDTYITSVKYYNETFKSE